ncbi:MAG: HAMP domain-containing sensor histidine kinase [bacterium]
MFKSAIFKLTFTYLLIIMAISSFFSVAILGMSTSEINNTLRSQQRFFERGPMFMVPPEDPNVLKNREQTLEDSYNNLFVRLIYINIGILLLGGGISFLLAKLTLKPLEESHERQSRFVSDASHELRSPLAAMQAEIDVTLRDKNLDKKEAIKVLTSNKEEVEKMGALVSGLLDLARDRRDKIEMKELDIVDLVNNSLKTLVKPIKEKSINLVMEIPDNIKVKGSSTMLTQLFTIIIDNAVKYSPEKGEISIVAKKNLKDVFIRISDHGSGISKDNLQHIFDRFYRADTSRTKNHVEGYGIGLSIAENIVTVHNGRITASSEPEKGSCFTIILPS